MLSKIHVLVSLVLLFALGILAHMELSGRVVDNASLLSPAQKAELEASLTAYEKQSSNQVVVVTTESLLGKNIEDFGYELGRQWGIGSKEKNNGVLFIIAPQERMVRLEVGYGLEGILTDARSKLIIERNILPFFRKGEMGEGIIQGTKAIIATLGGQTDAPEEQTSEEVDSFGLASFMIFIIVILVFLTYLNGPGRGGPRFPNRQGPFYGSGSEDPRGGDGGFRGGGGSFGGGGASGKW